MLLVEALVGYGGWSRIFSESRRRSVLYFTFGGCDWSIPWQLRFGTMKGGATFLNSTHPDSLLRKVKLLQQVIEVSVRHNSWILLYMLYTNPSLSTIYDLMHPPWLKQFLLSLILLKNRVSSQELIWWVKLFFSLEATIDMEWERFNVRPGRLRTFAFATLGIRYIMMCEELFPSVSSVWMFVQLFVALLWVMKSNIFQNISTENSRLSNVDCCMRLALVRPLWLEQAWDEQWPQSLCIFSWDSCQASMQRRWEKNLWRRSAFDGRETVWVRIRPIPHSPGACSRALPRARGSGHFHRNVVFSRLIFFVWQVPMPQAAVPRFVWWAWSPIFLLDFFLMEPTLKVIGSTLITEMAALRLTSRRGSVWACQRAAGVLPIRSVLLCSQQKGPIFAALCRTL